VSVRGTVIGKMITTQGQMMEWVIGTVSHERNSGRKDDNNIASNGGVGDRCRVT
jgi:hypothetical protein